MGPTRQKTIAAAYHLAWNWAYVIRLHVAFVRFVLRIRTTLKLRQPAESDWVEGVFEQYTNIIFVSI